MTNPAPSDSLLFFALSKKTEEALGIYGDIEEGLFPGLIDHLEEIKGIVDVPMLDSVLINAIDEVDASLKLAGILAEKYGLEKLRDRIQAVQEGKK